MIKLSTNSHKYFTKIKIINLSLLNLRIIQLNLCKRAKKIRFKINMTIYIAECLNCKKHQKFLNQIKTKNKFFQWMKNRKKKWLADWAKNLILLNQKDLHKETIHILLLFLQSPAKCLEVNWFQVICKMFMSISTKMSMIEIWEWIKKSNNKF